MVRKKNYLLFEEVTSSIHNECTNKNKYLSVSAKSPSMIRCSLSCVESLSPICLATLPVDQVVCHAARRRKEILQCFGANNLTSEMASQILRKLLLTQLPSRGMCANKKQKTAQFILFARASISVSMVDQPARV